MNVASKTRILSEINDLTVITLSFFRKINSAYEKVY
mgnify:CR=1 FL=1